MSMQPLSGFVGGAYKLPSKNVACQRCLNMFVEKVGTEDEARSYLLGTPGFTAIEEVVGDVVEGGIYVTSNGFLIIITESKIYAFKGAVGSTLIPWIPGDGQVNSTPLAIGDDRIAIFDNGVVLFFCAGDDLYAVPLDNLETLSATFLVSPISGWLYGRFTHIDYMDGRFIINTPEDTADDPTHNQFRVSPLDWDGNPASWDPLAVASADQSPDPLLALIVRGRDLLLFSSGTFEVWYDAGLDTQPFGRNISIANEIGINAKYSLAKAEETVFWLGAGKDGFSKIFMLNGYQAQRISTHAIEYEIATYSQVSDAVGTTYQKNGHTFYIINFQVANKTWQYDLSTGEWNELSSTATSGQQERYRVLSAVPFSGLIIGFDRVNLNPVILDFSTYTEDDEYIVRIRSTPHTYSGLNRIFFNRLQLNMETGVGITSGQGSDPLIRLRWSNDAGHTWSDFLLRSLGKIGEYSKRVIWNRLGQARHRVWEISTSEPVPIRILGLFFDAEEGAN